MKPKYGWTDVAQFTQLGIPAVNFGPGDPSFAHKADEHVPVDHLIRVEEALTAWLTMRRAVPPERESHKGPVRLRGRHLQSSTTDQRLLDSRGRGEWVHTDPVAGAAHPGRVRRGLRGAGRARSSRRRVRIGADQARRPHVRDHAAHRREAVRPRLRRHHRWRSGRDGGRQPRRQRVRRRVRRPRHRAPARAGPQRLGRPRHQLPLLLRAQDDVRQVLAGLRRHAGRLRHHGRAVRGADAGPDAEDHLVPDRPVRHRSTGAG